MGDPQTGREWVDAYLQAQAKLMFEATWIAFGLGQMGVLAQFGDDERLAAALDDWSGDFDDLEAAAANLVETLRNMRENVGRNRGLLGETTRLGMRDPE
jgi:hypothetical protein